PQVRAALSALDPGLVARQVRAGLPVTVSVQGDTVELAPGEIIVHAQAVEGLAVAAEGGTTVAIDTLITPELAAEGLVRDLVRHVQTLRKEADYRLDDRITVGLFGLGEEARRALAGAQGYLCEETLCTRLLTEDDGHPWDREQTVRLAGGEVRVAVRGG
ncbi:MAG: DUF5915 domain-containing protein, partial [Anaerolineae bacterium]|nr:DUF5915 domain-containing protein [Anaerolineae bacterium]